jgi:hypothetical protein
MIVPELLCLIFSYLPALEQYRNIRLFCPSVLSNVLLREILDRATPRDRYKILESYPKLVPNYMLPFEDACRELYWSLIYYYRGEQVNWTHGFIIGITHVRLLRYIMKNKLTTNNELSCNRLNESTLINLLYTDNKKSLRYIRSLNINEIITHACNVYLSLGNRYKNADVDNRGYLGMMLWLHVNRTE